MNPGLRFRICLSVGLIAAVAGCASVQPPASSGNASPRADVSAPGRGESPATPTIPVPVPVEIAPAPFSPAPVAVAEASVHAPASPLLPDPVAEPGDLLVRVRSGFALGSVHHSRIDTEADWFARNPQYVERVFTRAAPYLQYIVNQVEARGLPLEIALLPIIESAFQPYAYSSARATGLWQFIASTGGRFGLKQDWWYDGRRDVVAATQAALDYLEFLRDTFDGDWLHAIAAYNCGEGNVAKAIKRNVEARKPIDFWNLKLPKETQGYVPRLLAMSQIVADPEVYGLSIEGMPDVPYFQRVETGGQISMEVAAELAGLTTGEMYDLNPAHHRWATDPTGPHFLLVPVDSAQTFSTNLLQLTPDQRMRVERYSVRDGDTVTSIAQRFGTTAQHLRELNELGAANNIKAGAELRVPSSVASLPPQVLQAAARVDGRNRAPAVTAVHVVRKGDSLWSIAKRHNMDVIALAQLNRIKPTDTLRAGQKLKLHGDAAAAKSPATSGGGSGKQVTYVVRSGDTLSSIARNLRVTVNNLREWNKLSGSGIRPGQKLVAFVSGRS